MTASAAADRCQGSAVVCEFHPRRPWGPMCCDGPRWTWVLDRLTTLLPYWGPFKLAWLIPAYCEHGACHCGGAGDPCPDCCPPGEYQPRAAASSPTINGISIALMRSRFTPEQAARIKWQELALRACTDPESLAESDRLFDNDPGHRWFCFCLDAVAREESR